jgi:ATP-dependent DNA helicase RecQ
MSSPRATIPAVPNDRTTQLAGELLIKLAGPEATFHPGQFEAIRALVDDRSRALVVQRTGWGKSAVYFIATKLLREAGLGATILISPLLALMRNQIQMGERLGVRAATINSSNREEWEAVAAGLQADTIDLLLISPERFANAEFRDDILPMIASRTGLLVIDEVHCISDWGHDFRPDYRRIGRILDLLPRGIPVLGTTATANDRVVNDVIEQLGGDLVTIRGPLGREGLALQVELLPAPAQRLAWLLEAIPKLSGSGIVYCLTIPATRLVADWLRDHGIDAVAYSGDTDDEQRMQIESDLLSNRVKVVAATSALGMGFDKPDVAFVIHYQSPGSPIAYYQQVGRAGRALATSYGILLSGNEDRDIQDYFIRSAFPSLFHAEKVVGLLQEEAKPLRLGDIEARVNIRRGRLEQMMKILEVEGVVERVGSSYRRTLAPWTYPAERVEGVTAARRAEQAVMELYGQTTECLMEFLRLQLDDPQAGPCGICANCAGKGLAIELGQDHVLEAIRFLRRRPIQIEPRRQWPAQAGRIPAELRLEPGRALSSLGDGGWSDLVHKGKDEEFADRLVEASVRLIAEWGVGPAWITSVPSLSRPTLVASFAERLGTMLGVPVRTVVRKVRENRPQKEMENSVQQHGNVADFFRIDGPVDSGPVLLVDDLHDSRWTLTVVGVALREAGSGPVFPFTLAAAVST